MIVFNYTIVSINSFVYIFTIKKLGNNIVFNCAISKKKYLVNIATK